MRRHARALIVGSLLAIAAAYLVAGAGRPQAAFSDDEKAKSNLGKTIAKLELKDVDGKSWALGNLKSKKAIVVIFIGTECPINNAYMPRLAELHKEYTGQGVQFLAVNSNKQDTAAKIAT